MSLGQFSVLKTTAEELIAEEINVLVSGFHNVYSPSIIEFGSRRRLYTGGWKSGNDIGNPDKLYYSEFIGGKWSGFTPSNGILCKIRLILMERSAAVWSTTHP